ncbi:MAG TPA: preprotein translocase subunit SecE [Vicinamibacteria bacterium]|nr:preprotein translocase subunit SecE [Vicinamibacteria bacterium]
MEKAEGEGRSSPTWLQETVSWTPRKWAELKTFFSEVRSELKSVTWPAWTEVRATTLVVVLTTVFFGFYLYSLDLVMSEVFARVLKQ